MYVFIRDFSPISANVQETFAIDMLLNLANRSNELGAVLRLEQIGQLSTGYLTKTLPNLKQQKMRLEDRTIIGLARVCKALDLDPSMTEGVASVVMDIIQSYGIVLDPKTVQEWRAAASTFAKEMYYGSTTATLIELEGMKYAFLNGK